MKITAGKHYDSQATGVHVEISFLHHSPSIAIKALDEATKEARDTLLAIKNHKES